MGQPDKIEIMLRDLRAENTYLIKEIAGMQADHFRIHGELTARIDPLEKALDAVVKHCIPGYTPSQMMRCDRPWQLAAMALYGITEDK